MWALISHIVDARMCTYIGVHYTLLFAKLEFDNKDEDISFGMLSEIEMHKNA